MENLGKSKEEIDSELENENTKTLIIAPAANNAYLLNKVTVEFPEEIPSIINDESITLTGKMDIIKRKALVGLMIFPAHNDPDTAEKIDKFVKLIRESEGEKLDYLAPKFVEKQFEVGRHS